MSGIRRAALMASILASAVHHVRGGDLSKRGSRQTRALALVDAPQAGNPVYFPKRSDVIKRRQRRMRAERTRKGLVIR